MHILFGLIFVILVTGCHYHIAMHIAWGVYIEKCTFLCRNTDHFTLQQAHLYTANKKAATGCTSVLLAVPSPWFYILILLCQAHPVPAMAAAGFVPSITSSLSFGTPVSVGINQRFHTSTLLRELQAGRHSGTVDKKWLHISERRLRDELVSIQMM